MTEPTNGQLSARLAKVEGALGQVTGKVDGVQGKLDQLYALWTGDGGERQGYPERVRLLEAKVEALQASSPTALWERAGGVLALGVASALGAALGAAVVAALWGGVSIRPASAAQAHPPPKAPIASPKP